MRRLRDALSPTLVAAMPFYYFIDAMLLDMIYAR